MFAFQFVNSYCAPLYVAFWLRNLQRLRILLMTMMMVKQFVSQLQEKYQPRLFKWWRNRQAKKVRARGWGSGRRSADCFRRLALRHQRSVVAGYNSCFWERERRR